MISRRFVLGYHGCDESTAVKMVNGQEAQIFSTKEYDWLGNGIYFWEDSGSRAFKWSQNKSKEEHGRRVTMLPVRKASIFD